MTVFPQTFFSALPLYKHEHLEKPLNWTALWERLAQNGPAVLLESAGPTHDASHWVILAGGCEQELTGEQGNSSITFSDGRLESCDIWTFLDAIAKNEANFLPFPHYLSQAWFGLFSYE